MYIIDCRAIYIASLADNRCDELSNNVNEPSVIVYDWYQGLKSVCVEGGNTSSKLSSVWLSGDMKTISVHVYVLYVLPF